MIHILNHAKETGEVFSTLFPFKEFFYAKFGYVSLPQTKVATISLHKLSSVNDMKVYGTVKHFYLEQVFDQYYDFTLEMQALIHGMSVKTKEGTSFINTTNPSYVAFAYEQDQLVGCLVYTTKGFSGAIDIKYFYYKSINAKYLLLQFLARHIDQFNEVWIPIRPSEVPELWLNDLSVKISTRPFASSAMGRLIQVEELQGISVGSRSLTIKLVDQYCHWNEEIFTFKSENGILAVAKSNEKEKPLDCTLSIAGLSVLVYGGYNVEDFPFKNWVSDYKDDLECFQILKNFFPPILVFMHEDF